jgi:hypothetical protein
LFVCFFPVSSLAFHSLIYVAVCVGHCLKLPHSHQFRGYNPLLEAGHDVS